jgi:hypothetical protein
MDKVDLYVVTMTGRTADAIYFDLLKRPRGIGCFRVNVTTMFAHNAILHRLCSSSGEEQRKQGQGVQLLANLAIFSRTARALGAFGTLELDPAVFEPPPQESEVDVPVNVGAAPNHGFPCELLFMVRELKPLPDVQP